MKSIILTILFLIPLIGFASFPVKTTAPSDTIIETKKETTFLDYVQVKREVNLSRILEIYPKELKKVI